MESDILVDEARIKALGIFRTFEKKDGRFSFWTADLAYKFLVVNGRLVIGAIDDHSKLYAAWVLRDEPASDDLKARVEEIANAQFGARNWAVTAAGKIGADGQVTGWKSECFRVETPVSMQSAIAEEIARLFQAGELNPR